MPASNPNHPEPCSPPVIQGTANGRTRYSQLKIFKDIKLVNTAFAAARRASLKTVAISPSGAHTRSRLRVAVLELLIEEIQAARAEYARAKGKTLQETVLNRFLDAAQLFDDLIRLPCGRESERLKAENID